MSGRFVKNSRISVGSQIEVIRTIVLKTNLVTKFRYGLKDIETDDIFMLRRRFSLTVVWRRQSSLLSTSRETCEVYDHHMIPGRLTNTTNIEVIVNTKTTTSPNKEII